MHSSITISNEAVRRCRKGELWLEKKNVVGRKPNIPQIVHLIDKKKNFIAMALLSPASRYYLRIFSLLKKDVTMELWKEKILAAYKKRAPLSKITNAFRVVHAESDGIPGVVIDKYNDVWAMQITCGGAEGIKGQLAEIISGEFSPAAIIEKNKIAIRESEGLPLVEGLLYGEKEKTVISEGGELFEVDVRTGQKTGAYLDYRAFRLKAREFARGLALDAFSYQGWFACQIANSANRVIAVDSSALAIKMAEDNAKRNNHGNIEFIRADVFDFLKNCELKFDFIHLDPPSFAKGGGMLGAAVFGYKKMITDALRLVAADGILMVSSCSHAITEGVIERTVESCAKESGAECEFVYRGIQDTDHPVLRGHPESLYLKALAVRVVR